MANSSVKVSVLRIITVAGVFYGIFTLIGESLPNRVQSETLVIIPDWPRELPKESHRAHSPQGLSLVAPEGWMAELDGSDLKLTPFEDHPLRSSITVREVRDRFRHPVPLPMNGQFQDGKAFVSIQHIRSTHFDPVCHQGRVVFERNEKLYELTFRTYRHFTGHLPELVQLYLETFEVRPPTSLVVEAPEANAQLADRRL